MREIIASIHKSGKDTPKTLVSKTLAQALKKISKGQKFNIWAHVERLFDDDSFHHRNTKTFDSNKLTDFVDAVDATFDMQSPRLVADTGSTITYNVSLLPSGGKHTTSRQRENILNENTVVRVVNNDDKFFLYALAYLMNPKDKDIRKKDRTTYRFRIAELAVNVK